MTIASSEHAEAYEVLAGADPRLLLICEHASARIPEPWAWPEADAWIQGTHWAIDLGARELTFGLSKALGAPAILARFSRLLIDPNRPTESATLIRDEAEGRVIHLSREIDPADRARRIADYYRPYHGRIDRALRERAEAALLSVHTYTPVYDGAARSMEIGVLFESCPELGERFAAQLGARGWRTALNEPYSAADGFAFSPEDHGIRHGRPTLELEVRQDIAVDPKRRAKLLGDLVHATLQAYAISP